MGRVVSWPLGLASVVPFSPTLLGARTLGPTILAAIGKSHTVYYRRSGAAPHRRYWWPSNLNRDIGVAAPHPGSAESLRPLAVIHKVYFKPRSSPAISRLPSRISITAPETLW